MPLPQLTNCLGPAVCNSGWRTWPVDPGTGGVERGDPIGYVISQLVSPYATSLSATLSLMNRMFALFPSRSSSIASHACGYV
jgi:hypothetical protein